MTKKPVEDVRIRPETPDDVEAIHQLTACAFSKVPFSDGSEPHIIDRLRDDGNLSLSLVAEHSSGIIVGHIAFSPVTAGNAARGWYGLGPVSVLPNEQGKGIGRILIETGLKTLREWNAAGCALIGDPAFYARFGFDSGILSYGELDESYVQHIILDDSDTPTGELRYARAFATHAGA